MKIWTVDAFANRPYTGNPAAVALVDDFPADEICLKIAAEMNLSETAFLRPLGPDSYHIRWFTPTVEVQLCGHATLASAHVLLTEKKISGPQVNFQSLSGPLAVILTDEGLDMDFPLQKTGEDLPLDSFKKILKLSHEIKRAVQAHDDVIVEVINEKVLKDLRPLPQEIMQIDCRGLIVTAPGSSPFDFVSRFFAPRVGVPEDPVTGSAHCKLAFYWQTRLGRNTFLAYQASNRGGVLNIQIQGQRVHLVGQAVTIMSGEWKIPVLKTHRP